MHFQATVHANQSGGARACHNKLGQPIPGLEAERKQPGVTQNDGDYLVKHSEHKSSPLFDG